MSVEPIQEVIKLWERGEITVEQCLGKILLLVLQHHQQITTLEANARHHQRPASADRNRKNPPRDKRPR